MSHRLVFVLLLCSVSYGNAQQTPCAPLTLPALSTQENMFTPEQEVALGDATYEQIAEDTRIIDDPVLTSYPQQIAERLAIHLPTEMTPRVVLIDSPSATALSLPGGRVLLTRKLVALAKSEDELASVIAHELGHSATHDVAVDTTRELRALGVASLGSVDEVYQRLHELIENNNRLPKSTRVHARTSNARQEAADRLGLELMVRAGYDVSAHADVLERTVQTRGKLGNWWTDLWGSTPPDAKRVREAINSISLVQSSCPQYSKPDQPGAFGKWQKEFIQYSGNGHFPSLYGVIDKKKLDPPLLHEVEEFRFSTDRKHLLAQDESGIVVFTRDPFKALFRIDAPNAAPAHFTADNKSVVFYYAGFVSPRVERWSLTERAVQDIFEVRTPGGCLQQELSPNGDILLCLKPDRRIELGSANPSFYGHPTMNARSGGSRPVVEKPTLNLQLYDVVTGDVILEKKDFARLARFWGILASLGSSRIFARVDFTPDSHFLLAASDIDAVYFDLHKRVALPIPDKIKPLLRADFAFVGNDQLLGRTNDPSTYKVVSFPAGEVLAGSLDFGMGRPRPATSGEQLLVRPIHDAAVGIYDLKQRKFVAGLNTPAVDVFGGYYVRQRPDADIEVRDLTKHQVWDKALMPQGKFEKLRAAAASPDLTRIAISLRTRGAAWDISTTAKRLLYVRGFEGAYLPDTRYMYAQFPRFRSLTREIAQLNLDSGRAQSDRALDDKVWTTQAGPYVVTIKYKDEKNPQNGFELEVRDVVTNAVLWTRPYMYVTRETLFARWKHSIAGPGYAIDLANNTIAFASAYESDEGRRLAREDPVILRRVGALRDKKSALYVAIYDLQTGARLASLLLDTAKFSFVITGATLVHDNVILADSSGRILVFDKNGEQKGRFFARGASVSKGANVLCLHFPQGRMAFYSLSTLSKLRELTFPERASYWQMSGDGKRMLVVTADQTVYTLDLMKIAAGNDLTKLAR